MHVILNILLNLNYVHIYVTGIIDNAQQVLSNYTSFNK